MKKQQNLDEDRNMDINLNWYCSANAILRVDASAVCTINNSNLDCLNLHCRHLHRKHPTPEQFKDEYGDEYQDDGAVYAQLKDELTSSLVWLVYKYKDAKKYFTRKTLIACASTPWGKPPDNWRPE